MLSRLLNIIGLLLFEYFFGAFDEDVLWHRVDAEYVAGDAHFLEGLNVN